MNAGQAPVRTTALRMLLLCGVLGGAAVVWGEHLAAAWFPLWRLELPFLFSPHWRLERLVIDREGSDQVIRMLVGLRDCVSLAGRQVCDPGEPLGNASTLVGNLTLPTTLLLSLGLAWPSTLAYERALRLGCLCGAALLLTLCDVPLTLAAAFWGLWSDATGLPTPWVLVRWTDFLQSGGRAALGVLLAAAAIATSAALARRWSARQRSPGHSGTP